MRFDSALEVQARVFREVFDFTELSGVATVGGAEMGLFVDPTLLDDDPKRARARKKAKRRAVENIALGVSQSDPDKADSAKLAVLVQNRLQLNSSAVERIGDIAQNEVEIIYIGRQVPLWTTTRLNPIKLGCSVSPTTVTYAGTLGCFCRDNATGEICILSNNHVLADVNRVPLGTTVKQQGALDGGTSGPDDIAELLRFVHIQFGGMPNSVDAAIAKVTAHGRQEDRAGIFDNSTPSAQVATFRPGTAVTASPGMTVQKTGRTTCHTIGRVRTVNVNNYLVNMGAGLGVARFDGQITIDMNMPDKLPFSRSGDSGSIIVDQQGNPVALLFAGSKSGGAGNLGITGANPISNVMAQLGISLI
ncbi:hypothetical protein [Mesorhizobium sp. CN2-181]|uniref:hypothetical protein n=1 Tax=Mesorhizobium yinganensis TaxID=3157707 RepID=UPI0032B7336F